MQYIIALALVIAGFFGVQPANAEVNASSVESATTIEASKDASLPTYLTEVSTSSPSQVVVPSKAPEVGVPLADQCQEDEPCWDCKTMGNLQCGPTSQPAQQGTQQGTQCEEDMPCWDCSTMGNKVCGPDAAAQQGTQCEEDEPCWDAESMGNGSTVADPAMVEDAMASYESQMGQPTQREGLTLKYVGSTTLEPVDLTATQFTIPSSNIPNLNYVLEWVPVWNA
jgi:hypothetical protein